MHASEHTRLMNRFIGLCHDTVDWPGTLHELGYEVQLIEQTLSSESAAKITPDIVAVSNQLLHAIAADCKSGVNIDEKQNEKYDQLTPNALAYHCTVHDPKRLTHVACYVDSETNHESLKSHTALPFIVFGRDAMRTEGDFGHQKVDKKLENPVPLTGMREPTGLYPFSPDDEEHVIMDHVLTGLIARLYRRKGSPMNIGDASVGEEIFKTVHPYHAVISRKHQNSIIKKIRKIIDIAMNGNPRFKELITKIENGESNANTLQSLEKTCEKMITKARVQKRIDSDY